jgi:hypothetical protein
MKLFYRAIYRSAVITLSSSVQRFVITCYSQSNVANQILMIALSGIMTIVITCLCHLTLKTSTTSAEHDHHTVCLSLIVLFQVCFKGTKQKGNKDTTDNRQKKV